MRPRLDAVASQKVIELLDSETYADLELSPTKLLEMLICKEYDSLYPTEVRNLGNGNTEKNTKTSNP